MMLKRLLGKPDQQPATRGEDNRFNPPEQHTRNQLSRIVGLVARRSSAANHAIEQGHKHGFEGQGLDVRIGFEIYKGTSEDERCECWFELEYCDFINDKVVDEDMLNRVCDNIRRGKCPHVSDSTSTENIIRSNLSLIHVAVGSDNKDIVKLLLKLDPSVRYSRTACGLKPFHVALVKLSMSVIDFLTSRPAKLWWGNSEMHRLHSRPLLLAKRMPETRKVVIQRPYVIRGNVTNLLHMTENITPEIIKILIPVFRSCQNYLEPVQILLNAGRADLACTFIQGCGRKSGFRSWDLIVYCVLIDRPECLKALLKLGVSYIDKFVESPGHSILEEQLQQVGLSLVDIAKAFKRVKCLDILKTTSTIPMSSYQKISPFTFLINFALKSNCMDKKVMGDMISFLLDQGHTINHQDDFNMTPLMYAVELLHDPIIIKQLLSLGADVDMYDRNGRTPLYIAVTPYNSPLGASQDAQPRGIVKDLLLFNPDVNSRYNQNAVHYAAEKDLNSNSYLQYITDGCVKFKANSDDEQDIIVETYEERFIALSNVALLYEFGFMITSRSLLYAGGKHHLQVLSDYVARIESIPRTLQSACRLAIRKAYAGSQLLCMIQNSQLPKRLQDYVVKPYILRYVDVEYVHPDDKKEIIHVDSGH